MLQNSGGVLQVILGWWINTGNQEHCDWACEAGVTWATAMLLWDHSGLGNLVQTQANFVP